MGGGVGGGVGWGGGSSPSGVPDCYPGAMLNRASLPAGIGENGAMLRELALSGLEWAGISIDSAANEATIRGGAGEVQAPGSRVKVRATC